MVNDMDQINSKPELYEFYTAKELWTDEYTSEQMLAYHLNGDIDVSSRKTEFIDRSVEWIISKFNVGANVSIADFGCGPGLYTQRLAGTGAEVTGIDFSERSIAYAKEFAEKEKLSINYVNENYLEYETEERFDVILMIFCDFCVLDPSQRQVLLRKFHTFLKPGGYILFDVNSLNAFDKRKERSIYEINLLNGFWAERDYKGYLNTFKYEKEKVVLDKYTIIEPARTRVVYNWFKHFSPEELEEELSDAGFKVEQFYSDIAGTEFDPGSPEFAVIAKK